MAENKTAAYADVLKDDFYCHCGAWVYCPEMNSTKIDKHQNKIPCMGEGCTKNDEKGEYMECPECGEIYYLI